MASTPDAPSPKKRGIFKRAAWQDALKNESGDMFSHTNQFNDIVAEERRREEEAKQRAEKARREKQVEERDCKRRKISEELYRPEGRSKSSRSPKIPALESPYVSNTPAMKATSSIESRDGRDPIVIDLGDSDDGDSGCASKTTLDSSRDALPQVSTPHLDIPLRSTNSSVLEIDDDPSDPDEPLDPTFAALAAKARARARAAQSQQSLPMMIATNHSPSNYHIAQLFISPEIPGTKPLMVKVRIDSTLERPRAAWCTKQGFSAEQTRNVFFTWRGSRIYDSTTIKRLGIKVDEHGHVSIEGDTNLYDDTNLPKIHVQAWTEETFAQWKKEKAARTEASRWAAEVSPEIEERFPSPEPAPKQKKLGIIMKAQGCKEWKVHVNPDTTFGHLAHAFKQQRNIAEQQPVTLMFDGERLPPMDTVADADLDDMDMIDVLIK